MPRRLVALLSVVLLGASGCRRVSAGVEVERNSPAIARGQLVEDLGLETIGGVFTPLLARGRQVPCEVTNTFGTAADNQTNIQIRLVRGTAGVARDCTPLGHFTVEGLPQRSRGVARVAITLAATAEGTIVLDAKPLSGRPVTLRRSDD